MVEATAAVATAVATVTATTPDFCTAARGTSTKTTTGIAVVVEAMVEAVAAAAVAMNPVLPLLIPDRPLPWYQGPREEEEELDADSRRRMLEPMQITLFPALSARAPPCWSQKASLPPPPLPRLGLSAAAVIAEVEVEAVTAVGLGVTVATATLSHPCFVSARMPAVAAVVTAAVGAGLETQRWGEGVPLQRPVYR